MTLFFAAVLAISLAAVVLLLAPLRKLKGDDGRVSSLRLAGVAAVIAAPLAAGVIYLNVGAPESLNEGFSARQTQTEASAQENAAAAIAAMPESERAVMIKNMVAGLEARLRDNPSDIEGWRMLARSYGVLNQPQKAAAAYKEIVTRDPDASVDDWRGYAGALVMARPQGEESVSAELVEAVSKLKEFNEDDPLALFYLGVAAHDEGDSEAAIASWGRLLELMPADAPFRETVEGMIAEAAGATEQ